MAGPWFRPPNEQGGSSCHRTVKHPESRRTPWPTTPTCTRSSARTSRTPSRSSRTSSRCEYPPGGPNFFEFGDDVTYEIHIGNDGDARRRTSRYRFQFNTHLHEPEHVPVQHGADHCRSTARTGTAGSSTRSSMDAEGPAAHGARRRTCRARRATSGRARPRTTTSLADAAIHTLGQRRGRVHRAAQRGVLRRPRLDLRPRRPAAVPAPAPDPVGRRARRRTARAGAQRPHASRSRCRSGCSRGTASNPTDPADPKSVDRRVGVGVPPQVAWCATTTDTSWSRGPWTQVSRLGNPLFNEVIVPMARKDDWNAVPPVGRQRVPSSTSLHPELAKLLPVLYPGVFPNLAGLTRRPRRPGGDPADRHPERA